VGSRGQRAEVREQGSESRGQGVGFSLSGRRILAMSNEKKSFRVGIDIILNE